MDRDHFSFMRPDRLLSLHSTVNSTLASSAAGLAAIVNLRQNERREAHRVFLERHVTGFTVRIHAYRRDVAGAASQCRRRSGKIWRDPDGRSSAARRLRASDSQRPRGRGAWRLPATCRRCRRKASFSSRSDAASPGGRKRTFTSPPGETEATRPIRRSGSATHSRRKISTLPCAPGFGSDCTGPAAWKVAQAH